MAITSKVVAQGLTFQSNANSIEQRTSFSVFNGNETTFAHQLNIKFSMQLPLREDVGYVIRIVDEKSNNVFNVFYDGRGNDYMALNEEGYKSILVYHFNREQLRLRQWFNVQVCFDFDKKKIAFSVDGHKQSIKKADLPNSFTPQIIFGRSDYLIDVPTFSMKDLVVSNMDNSFVFPLCQSEGNNVYTNEGKRIGYVENPYWAINDSYHWKKIFSSESDSPAGNIYNAKKHQILYYNNDIIYIHNIMSQQTKRIKFVVPCPVTLYLGTSFIDENGQKLYTYETYRDGKTAEQASIASLNLNTLLWNPESTEQIEDGQMHHHGAFFMPDQQHYTIYGGFANMRYNAAFYTYDINKHHWTIRNDIKGEKFPRYFLSMGYDGKRYVYIFGGMGNDSGDQTVGRRFFYDLHRLDLRTKKIEKLWDVNWNGKNNSVFVKNMIVRDGYFYTMGYSEFLSDSHLKLYRFSIKDGSYQQLGDSIPIHPDRIETEANLFYDPLLHKFIATVQEYKNEHHSVFNAYTINAPVLSEEAFNNAKVVPSISHWFNAVLAIMALLIILFIIYHRYKHRKQIIQTAIDNIGDDVRMQPNAMYLFGNFQVFNSKGQDISFMFTDKLRQIICLMMQYGKEGIPSRHLGNIMWGDKTADKIKNSRSVAINHLRKALEELTGIEVIYKNSNFILNTQQPFYCDYQQLLELISSDGILSEADINEILLIVGRGKFLSFNDNGTLDSFRAYADEQVLAVLRNILHIAESEDKIPIMLKTINCIFNIDPINDEAYRLQIRILKRLGRNLDIVEAQLRYKTACKEYYGQEITIS